MKLRWRRRRTGWAVGVARHRSLIRDGASVDARAWRVDLGPWYVSWGRVRP